MSAERQVVRVLERERAAHAFRVAQALEGDSDFAQVIKGVPVNVRTQGLTLAVASLLASTGTGMRLVSELSDWLLVAGPLRDLAEDGEQKRAEILEVCVRASNVQIMALQKEALAWLEFVKRFALALEAVP